MASASLPPTTGPSASNSSNFRTMMPESMPAQGPPSSLFRTTLPDSMPSPGHSQGVSPGGASFPSQGPSPFASNPCASFHSRGPPSPGPGQGQNPMQSQGPFSSLQGPPFQTMPPQNPMASLGPGSFPPGPNGSLGPMGVSMPAPGSLGPMGVSMPAPGSLGPMGVSMPAPGADNVLPKECLVVVSKLLDVPVETGIFGAGAKTYFLRVLDHKSSELVSSDDIQGMDDFNLGNAPTQTFAIPPELGSMRAKTTSRTIHVEVSFSGVMGGSIIGACQINRMDPRSKQAWPYEICRDGAVVCGIELRIVEDPDTSQLPTPGAANASVKATGSIMDSMGLGRMVGSQYLTDNELDDVHHGVSSMLELHGAKDLPAPRTRGMKDVVVTVMTDSGRELRKLGLFESQEQIGRQLTSVDFQHTRTFVQAPLRFGGDAQEGTQYIKVALSYGKRSGSSTTAELIGVTDAIKVSWKPLVKQYKEIKNQEGRVLGGIYLSHRLVTEAESLGERPDEDAMKLGRRPQMGPPLELEHRVSGRTGNFPSGSPEEALEQAVINAEAQNRALMQRLKKEDQHSSHDFPGMREVNGYREWENLDAVFQSMGPNPLVLSEDLGPQVSRGYQHTMSVARDVARHLPGAKTPADQILNLEMLRMFYKDDPSQADSLVRPVVCKDPTDIANTREMSWCPDPPVYVPIANMTEQDKETLRLACYRPEQTANLLFVDANPNYNIKQDIWGALQDEKMGQRKLLNAPRSNARVKDDCIMA